MMLAMAAVLIGSLGFIKYRQIDAAIKGAAAFQPPPEAVTTIVAHQEQWPATLSAIGTVVAAQGVTIAADLPGVVDQIHFESGQSVHAGDVLIELDTRQEKAQLAAAEAQRDLGRANYERLHGLVEDGVISKAEYDQAEAERRSTEAHVQEIRATIARKTN